MRRYFAIGVNKGRRWIEKLVKIMKNIAVFKKSVLEGPTEKGPAEKQGRYGNHFISLARITFIHYMRYYTANENTTNEMMDQNVTVINNR